MRESVYEEWRTYPPVPEAIKSNRCSNNDLYISKDENSTRSDINDIGEENTESTSNPK